MWRLIAIGVALGLLLTIVGGRIFGVDLWTLVKLGRAASIVAGSIVHASSYTRAAWRPLSTSEVDEVFGFPMTGYGRHGTFSGVVFDRAAEALGHTDFAIGAQALQRNLTAGTGATMG